MSVATAFQIGALVISATFALIRLPMAIQGRNPILFWALLAITTAVGLSIPFIYLPVDAVLGGANLANLVLRYATYAMVILVGASAAAGFSSPWARRFITGPFGLAVLILTVVTTTVLFGFCDMPVSSPGLQAYMTQPAVWAYSVTGRLYPAYIAACLVIPALRAAATRGRPPVLRIGSALIGVSLLETIVWSGLWVTGQQTGVWDFILPHSSIILLAVGLGFVAIYGVASKLREKQSLLTPGYTR